jgi:hypothetical protein
MAGDLQEPADHVESLLFVVNDQDGTPWDAFGLHHLRVLLRQMVAGIARRGEGARQVEADAGPVVGRAVDGQMALVALNDAEDHGQTQAGALADVLGREEGVEGLAADLGRHAQAVVLAQRLRKSRARFPTLQWGQIDAPIDPVAPAADPAGEWDEWRAAIMVELIHDLCSAEASKMGSDKEQGVAPGATDVLRQAGPCARHAHGVLLPRFGRDAALEQDLVLPAVPEVVLVPEPEALATLGQEVADLLRPTSPTRASPPNKPGAPARDQRRPVLALRACVQRVTTS